MSDFEITKIKLRDEVYPEILKRIKDPPKQIYVQGDLSPHLLTKSIAIVGSRKMTRYGADCIDKFVADLVAEGVTTISGFMYGVDTQVHQKTLDYGGRTIAVLGNGLNYLYPSENSGLYKAILKNGGAIISEYQPESKPQLWKYPARNRIVSGLASIGVLIIEAAKKSGSLITAELAIEQKKNLFALPGPINSSVSTGTNELIKSGKAKLVASVVDILGKKAKTQTASQLKIPDSLSPQEIQVWKCLSREAMSVDELAQFLEIPVVELSTTVSMLALRGVIAENAGKYYLV